MNKIEKELLKYPIIGDKRSYKIKRKCKDKYFDPDSSPDAWENFLKRYTNIIPSVGTNISLEEDLYIFSPKDNWVTNGSTPRRIMYKYKLQSGKFIRLSGDCDFNFRKTRFSKFEMIIKKSGLENSKKIELLNRLYICNILHHTCLNFSLFPVGKEMQFIKGRKDDRLDIFLKEIKMFYKNPQKSSLNKLSIEIKEYLKSFGDFNNYVKCIYHIDYNDKEEKIFLDKMLKTPYPISTVDNLVEYIDNVIEYWNIRMKYFNKLK